MSDAIGTSRLEAALREHFGLERFRPLQREIVSEVLAGRPAMAILPTGGGKSLCYQLPAMLLPGATLVVSPLISLMKDQVDALVDRGVRALAINSQDTVVEGRQKLEALASGEARLVFVAPERLKNGSFLEACRRVRISLLAVDEAHCVSQWGHDFRPDYRYIKDFHSAIGSPPLLALTATARPEVRADVMRHLGIEGAQVFSAGANRENLWLGMETCATVAEKRARIAYLTRHSGGSTIIYVSSRKDAETWAEMLERELAEPVASYHAGLSPTERTAVQNRFMAGFCRVVVATNAFGMGIDKPDIRAVIHAGVPDSLEAYFQEVGRAGRDGLPAACTMVLVPGMDVKVREYLLGKERMDGSALEAIFRQIERLGPAGILPLGPERDAMALLAISHLQALGHLELIQRGPDGLEVAVHRPLTAEVRAEVRRRLLEHEKAREERFARMRIYIYLRDRCRRSYLLRYFGERGEPQAQDCCSACHPRPLPEGLAGIGATGRKQRKGRGAGAPPVAPGVPPVGVEPHPPEQQEALFERLRQWRRGRATEKNVPPYVIFGDKDLIGIAAAAPDSLEALAACRGVGPAKLEQYGAEVLAEIASWRATRSADASDGEEPVGADAAARGAEAGPDGGDIKPDVPRLSRTEMLARAGSLFATGTSVAEVAAQLSRAESTVAQYFLDWIAADETGAWKKAVRRVISPDDYRAIRRAVQDCQEGGVRVIFEHLEERYRYDQIKVALAVMRKTGDGVRPGQV